MDFNVSNHGMSMQSLQIYDVSDIDKDET